MRAVLVPTNHSHLLPTSEQHHSPTPHQYDLMLDSMNNLIKKTRYKTTIASILGALVVFALAKGYIDGDTATFISSILVAL